jgi:hypothetical protein
MLVQSRILQSTGNPRKVLMSFSYGQDKENVQRKQSKACGCGCGRTGDQLQPATEMCTGAGICCHYWRLFSRATSIEKSKVYQPHNHCQVVNLQSGSSKRLSGPSVAPPRALPSFIRLPQPYRTIMSIPRRLLIQVMMSDMLQHNLTARKMVDARSSKLKTTGRVDNYLRSHRSFQVYVDNTNLCLAKHATRAKLCKDETIQYRLVW